MITPEMIVAKDQVAALSDKAWLLFCEVVFRIIKGKEQTLKNIIAIPQERNESWMSGIIFNRIDSMSTILIKGTKMAERVKKGFNLLDFMWIPNGNEKASAPINLKELKDAISGSLKPSLRKYIFKIRMNPTWTRFKHNSTQKRNSMFEGKLK